LTCDTCHVDGGRFSHRLGSQRIPSLITVQRAFPLIKTNGQVVTLENQINLCLTHRMDGPGLASTSPKLALLDLYLRHLSRFHER
jgi:cytochrome c